MSLIEQLGGHARAVRYLENGLIDGVNKILLERELLEYRREHGVYDKGDKVVYVDDFMHDEISVISNIDDRVWLNDDAAVCIIEMVRHATPEEIQAGQRL